MKEINFVNAQKMHKKVGESFYAPSQNQLDKLNVKDIVKISYCSERFWAIVTNINGDNITAKVDNNLELTEKHGLRYNSIVKFSKNNIFDILFAENKK